MNTSKTHDADTKFLVRHSMKTGYQFFSLLAPPVYTTFILLRRGRGAWSLNKFLQATWIGGLTGVATGGGIAYGRYRYSNEEFVHQRRVEVSYDANRIRSQDYSTIGAVLMALLTPSIFWHKGSLFNLIMGGAGLGSATGTLSHYLKTFTGDRPENIVVVAEEKEVN